MRRRTTVALTAGLALASGVAVGEPLRKGPWLMDPRIESDGTASLVVMAERATPGALRVHLEQLDADLGTDAGPRDVRTLSDATSATLHEIALHGLRPHARYAYTITGDGIDAQRGTFTAAMERGRPFRFVIYGDTRTDHATHATVVHAIVQEHPEFVLHTGDLVEDGRSDALWDRFFDIEHDLLRDVPFVPVIGNHEIVMRGTSGVDHFRRYVHCEPSSPSPELDYLFASGDVRVLVANAYDDWDDPGVRAWLGVQLDRARSEVPDGFVIVAMHWGLCSSGPHGENRRARASGLDAFFREHRVDLLVSGHDHLYERGDDAGLRYILTGGGGAPLYPQQSVHPYTRVFSSEHHFVRADVDSSGIDFTALRPDGSVLDHCKLTHAGWTCPGSVAALSAAVAPVASASPLPPARAPAGSHACSCRAAGRVAPPPRVRCFAFAFAALAVARRRRRGMPCG